MNNSSKAIAVFIAALMFFSALPALAVGSDFVSGASHGNAATSPAAFIPNRHAATQYTYGPNGFAVNPYALYSSEPAPMGIADYGVGPGGSAYTYNSSSFLGTVSIKSLSVNGSQGSAMTFQENVVLVFGTGSSTYAYWIQDVVAVQSSYGGQTPYVEFIDNVWNMSSSNAQMTNSTISGNGTVSQAGSTGFYYDIASSSLPGQLVYTPFPVTVHLRVVSAVVNSQPVVAFQYNDGYGWVTYDNVAFKFAVNPSYDYGFYVDGSSYNPFGTFYDAELIMGGPGGGSSTTDYLSNVNLQLEYWNGNNYQDIPNAYNFGSDTAESMTGVLPKMTSDVLNGTIDPVFVNGSSALGILYGSNQVSGISIRSPVNGGMLYVNGTFITDFNGHDVNITLEPGHYSFAIYYANGTLYASEDEVLSPGEYLSITMGSYSVTFTETGLSSGTQWSVTLGGKTLASTHSYITFSELNGSYSYAVAGKSGYRGSPLSGNLTVNGANLDIAVTWKQITYSQNYSETGLPSGTVWWLNLSGSRSFRSTAISVSFSEPNGTYTYHLATADKLWKPVAYSGTLTVSGRNQTFSVTFEPVLYKLIFNETGLSQGTTWSVSVNGSAHSSTSGSISLLLQNGSYSYRVSGIPGYRTASTAGTAVISGSAYAVNISWKVNTYTVTVTETGLSSGTAWSFTLGGITETSDNSTIIFTLANGSYAYTQGNVHGYYLITANGTQSVSGSNVSISVEFAEYSHVLLTVNPSNVTVYLNGKEITAVNGTVNITLKQGTYDLEVSRSGYKTFYDNFTISQGQDRSINADLKAVQHTSGTIPRISDMYALFGILIALALIGGTAIVLKRRK